MYTYIYICIFENVQISRSAHVSNDILIIYGRNEISVRKRLPNENSTWFIVVFKFKIIVHALHAKSLHGGGEANEPRLRALRTVLAYFSYTLLQRTVKSWLIYSFFTLLQIHVSTHYKPHICINATHVCARVVYLHKALRELTTNVMASHYTFYGAHILYLFRHLSPENWSFVSRLRHTRQ